MAPVNYFLYHHQYPVDATLPEWGTTIPVHRPGSTQTNLLSISYGDYFTAVSDFLNADNGHGLIYALSRQLNRTVSMADIDQIDIIIQKHGAFYHPARVEVRIGSHTTAFVVNVAISAEGRDGLGVEFDLLQRLNESFSRRYVPAVYYQAVVGCEKKQCELRMFLGEWLNGFHEFHIHLGDGAHPTLHVWNPNQGVVLDNRQKIRLYRQVAEILTYYYNLQTFEQIFPWHHAAGDFVVRIHGNKPIVRLITVRGYSSLVDAEARDPATILDALLRFFIHLSLRTRIDRVDGTGDLIWADNDAVVGTLLGFFDGLAAKSRILEMSGSVKDFMGYHLSHLLRAELVARIEDMISAYPSQSPERHQMALHQRDHAEALYKSIAELPPSIYN